MGKYEKKVENKKKQENSPLAKVLLSVCVFLLVGALVVLLFFMGQRQNTDAPNTGTTEQTGGTQQTTQPMKTALQELIVHSVEQQNDMMIVDTSYCVLKYPFAFSDLIRIQPQMEEDRAALEFAILIDEKTYAVFTLYFGGSDGVLMGTLAVDGSDEPVNVYAVIHEAEESLPEGSRSSFLAAQEVINDVAASLAENTNFSPAG